MARESTYQVNPEERNGIFVKYFALCIAILLVVVVFIAVILLVYYLHPGWPCPQIHVPTFATPSDDLPAISDRPQKVFDGRLPDNLQPINYRVKFTPYMDEEDGDKQYLIDGEVTINVECVKSTDTIILHASHLQIGTVDVNGDDSVIGVADISADEEYDFFIIKTEETLQSGKRYNISMSYQALMNNTHLAAFFLNVYEEHGETRYLLASQLEAIDGRRVMPCFDEPALKATFDVIIKHRTKRSALSNMPNIRNETVGDWNTAYFDTTPVMPVYLLALLVSDFVCKEATTKFGVKFRVWASEVNINDTEFALDVGVNTLEYLEDLMQLPYPLPKLDMVSLPVFNDYGAMENWGLIHYKHDWILYDESVHHPPRAQRVARIIAHELAHMWFGNLVTMGWWNVSWLNEGFARHFEFVALEEVRPEWEMYEQFYQDEVTFRSMDNDASSDSHPTVQANVGWLHEIWSQFDTRVYERGSHMLRMLRTFLGDEIFFDGVRAYLNKLNYSNAFSDDLWTELTLSANAAGMNIDVQTVMTPWMQMLGFPVVTMSRDGDTNTASVSQKLFKLDSADVIPDIEEYKWYIPVTFIYSGNNTSSSQSITWINKTSGTLDLSDAGNEDWIILNTHQHAYYRVNYDMENWDMLIDQLKTDHKSIPVRNRAALIDDTFNLARSGDTDAVLAFRVMEYLTAEEDFSPWKAAIRNLKYVLDMLETSPSYGKLQTYVRDLILPRYETLGWNFLANDTHLLYFMRYEAIKMSCELNNDDCIGEAESIYSSWMDDKDENSIRDDIRATAMCTAIKHGDYEEWQFAYDEFDNTTDYFLKSDIAFALACTQRIWLLDMYMADFLQRYKDESSKTSDHVVMPTYSSTHGPANDFYRICGFVRDQSPVGCLLSWNFMNNHFDELRAIDENKAFNFMWGFASRMNTANHQRQLEDFARKYNDMPDGQVTAFYKALDQVKANIGWMTRNYGNLEEWLKRTN